MNDENRELLSAYIDGALPEAARKELEARIAASAELRRELDELRAVARAVRELPKEPLPSGFLVRFQARRARGDEPRRDWVFLPPGLRPIALALSCGVVALVIWDKVAAPPPEAPLHAPGAAGVYDAKNAPVAQFDLSAKVAMDGGSGGAATSSFGSANGLAVRGAATEPVRRDESVPYVADREAAPAAAPAAPAPPGALDSLRVASAERARKSARAAGSPVEADAADKAEARQAALIAERGARAMTEEERSARNEQMFGYLEGEKKKMGIARMIGKDEKADAGGIGLATAPQAPKIAAATPSMLKQKSLSMPAAAAKPAAGPSAGRLAPDAGLVFTDARSLSASWVLLGFPGLPPSVDFASGRLVLIKPSATKILSVTPQPNSIDVVYRSLEPEEASDPAQDRVAPIPLEPRTVLIFDASPR